MLTHILNASAYVAVCSGNSVIGINDYVTGFQLEILSLFLFINGWFDSSLKDSMLYPNL